MRSREEPGGAGRSREEQDLGGWVKNETVDISCVEALESVDFDFLPFFPYPASTAPGSISITL